MPPKKINKIEISDNATSATTSEYESIIPKISNYEYLPVVVDVSTKHDNDFFTSDPEMDLQPYASYPLFTNGFHHFIHANKNKMEILDTFKNKKKVYLIVNEFERYVDNYDASIGNISSKYFNEHNQKNKPEILSRGFYKLWELLFMFDLIPVNKKNFVSAHLAEGPGSFIQATIFFRDMFCTSSKPQTDKYHAITLHPDDEQNNVPELEKQFISFYNAENPRRFILHETQTTKIARSLSNKNNGDLTDPKTVVLFGGQVRNAGQKADFITADGGFNWKNENTQEQEAFRLIIGQIITAITTQNKGGNFVCKFFETYTDISIKLIYLLSQMYEKVYLAKPLTSRQSNSEKYAVCMNFKYNDTDKNYTAIYKTLSKIHEDLHKNNTLHVYKLWNNYKIPELFRKTIIHLNKTIANKQLKNINDITQFINSQNYYGDAYQMYHQKQIDSSKYWIKLFMPYIDDFNKLIKHCRTSTEKIIDKTKQVIETAKYN